MLPHCGGFPGASLRRPIGARRHGPIAKDVGKR